MLDIQQDLRAFMEKYHEALRAFNLKALESLIDLPFEVQSGADTYWLRTPFELRRDLRKLKLLFVEHGVMQVDRSVDLVYATGVSEAIAATNSEAKDAAGETLVEWQCSYLLKRDPRGWRIAKLNCTDQIRAWGGLECVERQATAVSSLN